MLIANVLSNDIRELIFNFIKRYPGVNYSALKNNLFSEFDLNDMKMGNGQIAWHLEVLLKFKFIRKLKFKKYVIYFPFEMEPQHAKFYFSHLAASIPGCSYCPFSGGTASLRLIRPFHPHACACCRGSNNQNVPGCF